jgi:hypothetical protein
MMRARSKAIHEKVNSLLPTLNLDTPLNGFLLHADNLCVIRYESQEEYTKYCPTLNEEDKEGG